MFKKTIKLCQQNLNANNTNLPPAVQEHLSLPLSKTLRNHFKSNEDLLKSVKLPYELRGEYLPRRPINAFRRRPLRVAYDHSHYMGFVLPSRRKEAYGMFEQEELFGNKRFRNDSPLVKEYIRIDNQIIGLILFFVFFGIAIKTEFHQERKALNREYLKNNMGIFTADDIRDNI